MSASSNLQAGYLPRLVFGQISRSSSCIPSRTHLHGLYGELSRFQRIATLRAPNNFLSRRVAPNDTAPRVTIVDGLGRQNEGRLPPFWRVRAKWKLAEVCVGTRFRARPYDDRSFLICTRPAAGRKPSFLSSCCSIKFARARHSRCRQSVGAVDSGKPLAV